MFCYSSTNPLFWYYLHCTGYINPYTILVVQILHSEEQGQPLLEDVILSLINRQFFGGAQHPLEIRQLCSMELLAHPVQSVLWTWWNFQVEDQVTWGFWKMLVALKDTEVFVLWVDSW